MNDRNTCTAKAHIFIMIVAHPGVAVSYTHLDVYKRQLKDKEKKPPKVLPFVGTLLGAFVIRV